MIDQEAGPLVAGAEHELDLGLVAGDDAARGIPARLLVEDAAIPALDRVIEPVGLEQDPAVGFVFVAAERGRSRRMDRSQRAAHRVLSVGLSDLRVTADTGRISHVANPRAGVGIGRIHDQRVDAPARADRRRPPRHDGRRQTHHNQCRDEQTDRPRRGRPRLGLRWHGTRHVAVLQQLGLLILLAGGARVYVGGFGAYSPASSAGITESQESTSMEPGLGIRNSEDGPIGVECHEKSDLGTITHAHDHDRNAAFDLRG